MMFFKISQNPQEKKPVSESLFNKFIKKETATQVYSCDFYKISYNTFFIQLLRKTVSGNIFLKNRYFFKAALKDKTICLI